MIKRKVLTIPQNFEVAIDSLRKLIVQETGKVLTKEEVTMAAYRECLERRGVTFIVDPRNPDRGKIIPLVRMRKKGS